MVTRYNSITTNKTFIELGKIKVYTEDVNTDEQEHEINALLEVRLAVQLPLVAYPAKMRLCKCKVWLAQIA